jgi:hypothetical protein
MRACSASPSSAPFSLSFSALIATGGERAAFADDAAALLRALASRAWAGCRLLAAVAAASCTERTCGRSG